jgi:predicted TIM-barrel fold metal-dependent hydrolase
MILDAHTHIFPPEICRHREDYFGDEPGFRQLYSPVKAKLVEAEELIKAMDEAEVEGAVTFGFPWRREALWRRHNEVVLEARRRWPGRLMGFCCVNPLNPGAPREVERCLGAGAQGVGELAWYEEEVGGNDLIRMMGPIAELCGQYGAPLMLHVNEPMGAHYPGKIPLGLADIYKLIQTFPETTWILAHWGGGLPFFGLLKKEVPEVFRRVYFDTAASPYLYRPEIYRLAADMVGPEKILLGSDYPLLPWSRYLGEIAGAGLAGDVKEMILGGNLAGLMGW